MHLYVIMLAVLAMPLIIKNAQLVSNLHGEMKNKTHLEKLIPF